MEPKLSIAIPAFNEAGNLLPAFEAARAIIEPAVAGPVEWLLVDDGSTDGTGNCIDELARQYPQVRKVVHVRRRGLGAAIWSGLGAASGTLFSWLPADGQIDPGVIVAMFEGAKTAELVMLMREEQRREPVRRALTAGLYGLFRVLLGFDPYGFSGIFLTERRKLLDIPLRSSSGVQNYSVVINALRKGQRIGRVSTVVGQRMSGRSKVANLRTTLRVLREVLALRAQLGR